MKILAIYSFIIMSILEYGLINSGLSCKSFKEAKVYVWSSIVYVPVIAFLIKYIFRA